MNILPIGFRLFEHAGRQDAALEDWNVIQEQFSLNLFRPDSFECLHVL